jgi:hypothetical protein
MGWSSVKNGELLTLAQDQFDVFITADRKLPSQQYLTKYKLSVVVLAVRINKLEHLIPLVSRILAVLPSLKPGTAIYLEAD